MSSKKEYKRDLSKHLYHFHGNNVMTGNDRFTLEQLEAIHDAFHTDGYACPPHSHEDDGAYEVGRMVMTLGENYVREIFDAAKEIL